MVALNFGMPRELAKTMEDQAKRELALIQPKQLGMLCTTLLIVYDHDKPNAATNNTETVRKLKTVFDGFRDAAKTYSEVSTMFSMKKSLYLPHTLTL